MYCAASSFDVLDARGRVGLELPPSLPQQELDGGEVTLLNGQVLVKLGPGKSLKVFTTDLKAGRKRGSSSSSLERLK